MAEEMSRIIHVKGVGKVSQAPDQVTISLELEATDEGYSTAVEKIADKISALRKSVVEAGFDTEDLKTIKFFVEPVYDNQRLEDGITRQIFQFYGARHNLELTFDFDNEKFNKALYTLTNCLSNPEISISFKIKDKTKIEEQLLKNAAEDARRKAEILCAASGAKLGKLLNIGCKPPDYLKGIGISESEMEGFLQGIAAGPNLNTEVFIPKNIESEERIDFYWEILD